MKLPSSLTFRGYAMNTSVPGNGWHYQHDHILAQEGKSAHFVRNHELGIEALAGRVTFSDSKKFDIEVPLTKDAQQKLGKESKTETATMLGFTAQLDDTFPGYQDVARAAIAQHNAGQTPNVSVFIYANDVDFDEDTDRFMMQGPYWIRHLGLVDVGGFSDEVGVGVHDIEVPEATLSYTDPTVMLASDPAKPVVHSIPMGMTVCVANAAELIHAYADKHEAMTPKMRAMGLLSTETEEEEVADVVIEDNGPAAAANITFSASGLTSGMSFNWNTPGANPFTLSDKASQAEVPEGPYKDLRPSTLDDSSESKAEDQPMSETNPTLENQAELALEPEGLGEQPASAPTKSGLSEEPVKAPTVGADKNALSAVEARLAKLEAERDAALTRVHMAALNRLAEKHALSDEEKKELHGMSEAQLSVLEKRLDAAAQRPPATPKSFFFESKHVHSKEDEFNAKQSKAAAWHKSSYLGPKEDY